MELGNGFARPGCPNPRVYDVTKEMTLYEVGNTENEESKENSSVRATRGWEAAGLFRRRYKWINFNLKW